MVKHTWKKLHYLPLAFCCTLIIAVAIPYGIAVCTGRLSPYVPYITEAGGHFPEAGIFTNLCVITSFLSQSVIIVRYYVADEKCTKKGNDLDFFINKLSMALGSLSTVSLTTLASFPTTASHQIHNTAAGMACVCFILYLVLHTWLSSRLNENPKISRIRFIITFLSLLFFTTLAIFGIIGSASWTADYSPGVKTPSDKGFIPYVVSASSEWALVILFVCFFITFVADFRKYAVHFTVEDEEENRPMRPFI